MTESQITADLVETINLTSKGPRNRPKPSERKRKRIQRRASRRKNRGARSS